MGGAATFVPAVGRVPAGVRAGGSCVRMKASVPLWLRLLGLLLLLLVGRFAARAQTGVTIGASTAPDASAALDIISTGKGQQSAALQTAAADPAGLLTRQAQVARRPGEGAPAGVQARRE